MYDHFTSIARDHASSIHATTLATSRARAARQERRARRGNGRLGRVVHAGRHAA
jgi:hypothetical protein